jgi:cytochrome c oxidase assembly protein subunit 15
MSYRLPLVTTVLLGIQIALGGIVVGKDAGFACPDWPLCQGEVLPKLSGLVILELVHRATALVVAILVVGIAARVWWKYRSNKMLVATSTLAVASLAVQIVVGGLIVLLVLPGAVTTIDVVNSMVLLALYIALTVEAYRCTAERRGNRQWPDPRLAQMAPTAWPVLYIGGLAVLMGAILRHTGAGEALYGMNHYLASHGQTTSPSLSMSIGLLILHIMSGMFVALAAMWLFYRALQLKLYVKSAALLLGLVALQFALGILSLTSRLDFVITTLHWSNAGAIVAVLTWVAVTARLAVRNASSSERSPATIIPLRVR